MSTMSDRGRRWFQALADHTAGGVRGPAGGWVPSVLTADTRLGQWSARLVSVVPDPGSRWPRARRGEVGIAEALALAASVRRVIELDRDEPDKTVIVAIVDVPSQAYGYQEELLGIHQALASAVDAYSAARLAGHPVISLLVGSAISGGFLAHGLQANRILALDDDGVTVQAMSRESTARVTRRSVEELERIAREVPATAYDGATFARLGAVHRLITVDSADRPTPADVTAVRASLIETVDEILSGPTDLSSRLSSRGAQLERATSRRVRDLLTATWNQPDGAT